MYFFQPIQDLPKHYVNNMENTEVLEELQLIATRVPPGDNWELLVDKGKVINGIVNTLSTYLRKTGYKGDYRLAPLDGKLYSIKEKTVEVQPQLLDIYGEYSEQ